MSAVQSSESGLRQVAILVSLIDAAAARQLLMQLPTETALKIRALAETIGPVSPAEQRQVLAAFQRSQSQPANPSAGSSTIEQHGQTIADGVEQSEPELDHQHSPDEAEVYRFDHLETGTLLRFIEQERPAVIAVVVNQLSPTKAVELLRQLDQSVSSDVLKRLSRLDEIDPEAKLAIEEHLSERLGKYAEDIANERQSRRKLDTLLAAAPSELRGIWESALSDQSSPHNPESASDDRETGSQVSSTPAHQIAVRELPTQDADTATTEAPPNAKMPSLDEIYRAPIDTTQVDAELNPAERIVSDEQETDNPAVLAFPEVHDANDALDRSLTQIDFEKLLELPPHLLATVLSAVDTQTVLLALAGATPEFIIRFNEMLDPRDARILQDRLKNLGPIQIRDIDEAQHRLVEATEKLRQNLVGRRPVPAARRAA